MCQVTDTVRLCTCTAKERKGQVDTWEFHRYAPGTGEAVVGSWMGPTPIDRDTDEANVAVLTRLLNTPGICDIDLKPRSRDRLLLTFHGKEGEHHYSFQYTRGRWRSVFYEPFSWSHDLKHTRTGCIKGQ